MVAVAVSVTGGGVETSVVTTVVVSVTGGGGGPSVVTGGACTA
jgi:hypothetical protein